MLLILDFTKNLSMAIAGKNIFIKKEIKTKKNISEILIFEINKFLSRSNIKTNHLKKICIITGPGSFTGVRSSITFAKIFKLTRNIDILGISKFEILNYLANQNDLKKRKQFFLHFKNKQFFYQLFNHNKPLNKPLLISLDRGNIEFDENTSYISDSREFDCYFEDCFSKKIKENLYYIDYNLNIVFQMIRRNIVNKKKIIPLYISNYY